ncbi:hypothetical protein BP5796_06062 [Coleophoma crateriformis]|uniref:Uncharacterized protein n=1 Tax=Coleophoma crateriformis TaxID=565419 RepID=A0A3D8RWA0_9HELO|nr:hypothetical protein BP5796_06062 [Coleophoma crateriformis]
MCYTPRSSVPPIAFKDHNIVYTGGADYTLEQHVIMRSGHDIIVHRGRLIIPAFLNTNGGCIYIMRGEVVFHGAMNLGGGQVFVHGGATLRVGRGLSCRERRAGREPIRPKVIAEGNVVLQKGATLHVHDYLRIQGGEVKGNVLSHIITDVSAKIETPSSGW